MAGNILFVGLDDHKKTTSVARCSSALASRVAPKGRSRNTECLAPAMPQAAGCPSRFGRWRGRRRSGSADAIAT
jgi:hypothetical protein